MPKSKKSTDLVQIQKSPIPPLRQSTQSTMSCPRMYTEIFIKGNKPPSGLDAARGTEIHKTMADYLSHCARKSVGMDLDAFEHFSHGAGPQAYKILSGLRDGYVVDHAHLFATEISMALDEHFRPTGLAAEIEGIVKDSGLPAYYQGTLDGIYVFREELKILIDDFKSHVRPYSPDDPKYKAQGDEYATFVLSHFPWVQTVVFRLTFVRYKNLKREVTYTREDLPKLIEGLKAARERQKLIHEKFDKGEEIEVISNDNCVYCPLLSNLTCPIASWNPMMQLSPEEWVKFDLFYSAFSKVNRARMKALIQGTGKPITLKDYNGKFYVYGPVESESSVYPLFQGTAKSIATRCECGAVLDYVPEEGLCPTCQERVVRPIMPIVDELESYAHGNPKDTDWYGKLVISSTELNSKLGAKKRSFLDQSCNDKADKVTKVKMKVSKPLDALPEEFEEDSEDNEWGEDEL
jgi:hypothetical protein